MSTSKLRAGNLVSKCSSTAIAVALLVPVLEAGALAQTNDDKGSFAIREVSLSTGYASVQLPPITLGGYTPNDVLNADLITTGTAAIDWRRVTSRTRYTLELFGMYTTRALYSRLSAPGGNLTFGVSRALGNRWRLGAGVASVIANSDQVASQPTQARRLVEDSASFDDLAGTVALARSPSPDLSHAALFVPIHSLDASDVYGNRSMVSSLRADATYLHSVRLATHFSGSYTIVRQISSNHASVETLSSPDSTAESADVGVRYDRSERTQLTADLGWSQTSGGITDKVMSATLGYGWSGRKWFTLTTVGAALRPFQTSVTSAPMTTTSSRTPMLIYNGAIGYRFRTQTLLVQYSRAPHDEYGHGGRNIATGFEGNVQSVVGSWSWSAPRSAWIARSDLSIFRGPGNFSYIYTWLSTVSVGRRLGPNVQLMGELLFDRHGSRGFEGFHLTREGARVNLVWTPPRRPIGSAPSGQRSE
jgi:hypothetical protein